MFNYNVVQILAFFIIIPAFLGIIRYKKIVPSFRPLLYFIWIGLLNEIISAILPGVIGNNAVNSNVYVLIEGLILLRVFYLWTFQSVKTRNIFIITGCIFVVIWLTDNVFINSITRFNSIYRLFYSLVIVFLSINQLNLQIIQERDGLLKNARFLVCTGFIIFFSYRMVFEVFYLYDFKLSPRFYNSLFDILIIVNLVSNIIYALSVAWIPTKQRFTLPY